MEEGRKTYLHEQTIYYIIKYYLTILDFDLYVHNFVEYLIKKYELLENVTNVYLRIVFQFQDII